MPNSLLPAYIWVGGVKLCGSTNLCMEYLAKKMQSKPTIPLIWFVLQKIKNNKPHGFKMADPSKHKKGIFFITQVWVMVKGYKPLLYRKVPDPFNFQVVVRKGSSSETTLRYTHPYPWPHSQLHALTHSLTHGHRYTDSYTTHWEAGVQDSYLQLWTFKVSLFSLRSSDIHCMMADSQKSAGWIDWN